MTALLATLIASLFSTPVQARMGASWGGSIVVIETSTGSIITEVFEPCMFDGYTGTDAFLHFERDTLKQHLKVSWDDVVFDTGGYKTTKMDEMGVPSERKKRELIFSVPGFSTASVSAVGSWSNAEMKPLPFAEENYSDNPESEVPPKLPTVWDTENGALIWAPDIFCTSLSGYGMNCFERKSGKKMWYLDLNPKNDPLPGGAPRLKVFDMGKTLLILTDRLGMSAVNRNTGTTIWHLPYGNVDVIPAIASVGTHLVVAPVGRQEDISCEEMRKPSK